MRRWFIVLCAAVVMVGLTSAPGAARQLTLRDGTGDVWQANIGERADRAPRVRNGDVIRTRLSHRKHVFVVRTRYATLRRTGSYAGYHALIGTRGGRKLEFQIEASPGEWRGQVRAFHRDGSLARCQAQRAIDYRHDTVTLTVPTRCLGHQRVLRAKVVSFLATRKYDVYTDNPHTRRAAADRWSRWVRRG